ncbi:MAG: L,D-transpeptidase family protein [Chromatiales bacterium]
MGHSSTVLIRHLRVPLSCIAFALLVGTAPSAAGATAHYEIEVIKSKRLLLVKSGDKVEKSFRVSSGRGGKGDKQKLGDHKTPVGIYRIVQFKDSENFHLFMQLNYPNAKDAFWGLKNHRINRSQFDAIVQASHANGVPPQDTPLGGSIGIHGLGAQSTERLGKHTKIDWTEGCIALTNEQAEELRRYVSIGTRVVIVE